MTETGMDAVSPLDDFGPELPRPGVRCTLVQVTGSAPQQPGAKMWVASDSFRGTLGGGRFEFEVIRHARDLLRAPRSAHLKEYVLCGESGQCCGGRVQVFFEPALKRRAAHLFGGGHVGRAVAQVLAGTPVSLALIDPRPEWSRREGVPPEADIHFCDPLDYVESRRWGPGDGACVFTHSHDLDFLLVKRLLRLPLGYLGLIGSEHKARVFLARLKTGLGSEEAGRMEELWESRVRCPMGVRLGSKSPKVVAISIAAQLLAEWGLRGVAQEPRPLPPAALPAGR